MIRENCFGVPSIFSFESETCKRCSGKSDCQRECYAKLKSVADTNLVKHLLSLHQQYAPEEVQAKPITVSRPAPKAGNQQKRELTEREAKIIESLPAKVGKTLRTIWTNSDDIAMNAAFERGENPFDKERSNALHAVYEVIGSQKISRPNVVKSLMTDHGWTYASAQSYVSMALQLFVALGYAERDGDFVRRK